jgi:lipopolysaccharide assembly outer membrane protein LptD (OstA)
MASQPSIPGSGWLRARRRLIPGMLSLALIGQGQPVTAQGSGQAAGASDPSPEADSALPALPPTVDLPGPLDLGELLPLRPAPLAGEPDRREPLRIRGRDVAEGPDGWSLEEGAVEGKDLLLLADRIRYHQATGEVEAEGHIRLEGPGMRMRCGRLRMDWSRQIGEAWELELELPPNWVLRSGKVEFNTLKHWEFEKVELSPCPEEKPGWKALVSELKVDLDHYAHLRNLWIWVFNLPTYYYLPWAIYPAKAERSSGVLPVSMSFSGAQGASFTLPYYQVLGPTADMTITPQYFSKEGVLWGGDLRWNPERTHKGEIAGEVINQRTNNERRYRLNIKELWQREDGWQFTADINRASDTLLDTDYGSGIARLGTNTFDSNAYLGKNLAWGNVSFNAAQQTSYFQPNDPFYRTDFPSSMKRENLPSVQLAVYPVPLGGFYLDGGLRLSRLDYNLDLGPSSTLAQSKYVWQRHDAQLHLAGRVGQWGPLRVDLQAAARFTHYTATLATSFYDTDNASDGSLNPNVNPAADPFIVSGPSADRLLGSSSLQFSAPPVGRTYPNAHLFGYAGEVKHVLAPFFALNATSRSSAEGRLPHFDGVDSQPGVSGTATGEQSLELGVKQHFFGRPGLGVPFLDLVRWKLSTKYNFRTILLADGRFQKGWASLDSDLDVEPNDKLHISFRSSTDVSGSTSDNAVSADYKAGDGTRFSLAYFSTGINRLLVRQKGIQVGALQRLWSDSVRLECSANYDFTQKGFATSQVGLAYVQPCVSESLRYSHVAINMDNALSKEDRIDLVLTLRNLGDLFQTGL